MDSNIINLELLQCWSNRALNADCRLKRSTLSERWCVTFRECSWRDRMCERISHWTIVLQCADCSGSQPCSLFCQMAPFEIQCAWPGFFPPESYINTREAFFLRIHVRRWNMNFAAWALYKTGKINRKKKGV